MKKSTIISIDLENESEEEINLASEDESIQLSKKALRNFEEQVNYSRNILGSKNEVDLTIETDSTKFRKRRSDYAIEDERENRNQMENDVVEIVEDDERENRNQMEDEEEEIIIIENEPKKR